MDIREIVGQKIVVHCNTEDKAKKFLIKCDELGAKWEGTDKRPISKTNWESYKNDTCYRISDNLEVLYEEIDFYIDEGYEIISYNIMDFES